MGQLNSRYYQAAIDGDVNKIEHYISKGANVNYRGKKKKTALWQACANDDNLMVDKLLHYGADPKLSDNEGWTPLLLAAHSGNLQIVKSLVEYSANVNQKSTSVGRYPLTEAAFYGHHKIVEFLIDNGVHVNLLDNKHSTALYMAAKQGKDKVVGMLLKARARPDVAVVDGSTPLYIACQCGHETVIKLLLEAGAQKEIKDKSGSTAMMVAARYNHLSVLKTMANAGCDLNVVNSHGDTALHYAAFHGHTEIVQFLLESDVDIIANKRGQEPIHLAERSGNKEIVDVLQLYSAPRSSSHKVWYRNGIDIADLNGLGMPDGWISLGTCNSSHTKSNVDEMMDVMPRLGEIPQTSRSSLHMVWYCDGIRIPDGWRPPPRTSNSSHTEDSMDGMIDVIPPMGGSPPVSPDMVWYLNGIPDDVFSLRHSNSSHTEDSMDETSGVMPPLGISPAAISNHVISHPYHHHLQHSHLELYIFYVCSNCNSHVVQHNLDIYK